MKRIIAVTLLGLATAPAFANDVASIIPAAPASSAPVVAYRGDAPVYGFGNADIVSSIPAPAAAGTAPVRESVAATKPSPFGNPDITCTM